MVRPLDPDKTLYSWKDLIGREKREAFKYNIKADTPTLVYFGFILGFVVLFSFSERLRETPQGIVVSIVFMTILLAPFGIEWSEKVALTYYNCRKTVAKMTLRLTDIQKTFEIEDEVLEWQHYDHGIVRLVLKNMWRVGLPDNLREFVHILIKADPKFLTSLDAFAHKHLIDTEIFGVPIEKEAYVFSLKTTDASWNSRAHEFTATSWATKETEGV